MRAKPLILWGLLAGIFTLPATTLALGLGKLTVNSNLGQPLSAHVELTAAQKEELDSLSADRKSTRLNSSHRCNSYAVFCLKKKKKFELSVEDKLDFLEFALFVA